jgi:hypothetical protein
MPDRRAGGFAPERGLRGVWDYNLDYDSGPFHGRNAPTCKNAVYPITAKTIAEQEQRSRRPD